MLYIIFIKKCCLVVVVQLICHYLVIISSKSIPSDKRNLDCVERLALTKNGWESRARGIHGRNPPKPENVTPHPF